MGQLHNLIANGGKVLVVGGQWNRGWDSFKDHPQLEFWTGDRKEISRYLRNARDGRGELLPSNTRGVVMSRFISHSEAMPVMEAARERHALIMAMKNDGEITQILEDIVTPTAEHRAAPAPPSPPPAPPVVDVDNDPPRKFSHGEQAAFVQRFHKPDLINAHEGRRLQELAAQRGWVTTPESMAQGVMAFRRKIGLFVGDKAKQLAQQREEAAANGASEARRYNNLTAEARAKAASPEARAKAVATRKRRQAEREARAAERQYVASLPSEDTRTARRGRPKGVKNKSKARVALPTTMDQYEKQLQGLLSQVDESILGMQLIREEVVKLHQQNAEFMKLKTQLAALIGGVK